MQRVVCSLPNASTLINGVKFASLAEGGMLSEEIDDGVAEGFCRIPGYTLWQKSAEAETGKDQKPGRGERQAKE